MVVATDAQRVEMMAVMKGALMAETKVACWEAKKAEQTGMMMAGRMVEHMVVWKADCLVMT